jgi:hypothetical protein
MEITKQEAFGLLSDWHAGQRVIQCGINIGDTRVSQIWGKIDMMHDAFIHISASRLKVESGDPILGRHPHRQYRPLRLCRRTGCPARFLEGNDRATLQRHDWS